MNPIARFRSLPMPETVAPVEDPILPDVSNHPGYQLNQEFNENTTISNEESSKPKHSRHLMMLALLAVAITYQVGLAPPGGFWEYSEGCHRFGAIVPRTTYKRRYRAFFYCNATAFIASLVGLILLMSNKLTILLAILGVGITYQAGLALLGGGSTFHLFLFVYSVAVLYSVVVLILPIDLRKEGNNKQRLAEARAVKEQGRRDQMEKLRALLRAGAPVRGLHMARTLAQTRLTLAPSDCFIVTQLLHMMCFAYSLHQDVLRSRKRFTYTVAIALLCALQNVFKAIGIPPKAQPGVTRDSESTNMGNRRETEQENTSGSESRVANHDVVNAVAKTAATWLIASAATHHATGNRNLLSGFKTLDDIHIQAGDGVPMAVRGRGSVITDTVILPDVMFVPGLRQNIVSTSQLNELDYSVGFTRGVCYIRGATDGTVVGKAPVGEDGMFQLEFLKVPLVN